MTRRSTIAAAAAFVLLSAPYVPDGPAVAIYYDDLGQTVPPPGLVPLGTIADPDAITRLGRTGRITLEPVVPPQR